MRFRSANPVFKRMSHMDQYIGVDYQEATYRGVAGKTLFFILMVVVGAFLGIFFATTYPQTFIPMLTGVAIVGFILGLVSFMVPTITKITGTFYCLFQGMLVGILSFIFEAMVPGVVITAITGTIAVVLVVSTLYLTGLVKVTGKFMRFLFIFSVSILLTHLVVWILSMVSPAFASVYYSPGMMILVSVVMIFLATLYLMFDLEVIRQVVEGKQPKEMEWFASFGLIFTIIWLYLEVLRLAVIILGNRS